MKKVLVKGVFDLFHVGHLNLLRNARAFGDLLIVAVATDDRAEAKGKTPIIPFSERIDIVRSIKFVDVAIPLRKDDALSDIVVKLSIDIVVTGDDYWGKIPHESAVPAQIIYLPYAIEQSTTLIKEKIRRG